MICVDCGTTFEAKGTWQIRCTNCFKKIKQQELIKLKSQITELSNQLYYYKQKLTTLQSFSNKEIDSKLLMDIIVLCHPDKHENSKKSNEVTTKLLDMRRKIK